MTKTLIRKGLVVYWELVAFYDRQRLENGWNALGFGKFVPEQRSPLVCLKDALTEVMSDRDTLVRPLKAGNGYAVVRETKGEDENGYATILNARVPVGTDFPVFSLSGDKVDEIAESFKKHRRLITANQVSSRLVSVAYSLRGTRLRRSGGLYWLAGDKFDDWDMATEVVIQAGDVPGTTVHVLEHELGPRQILAVKDGLVHDIETRIRQFHEELASGDLGERGLQSKADAISDLFDKVSEYEELLNVSLVDVRSGLEKLNTTIGMAQLLAMTGPTESAQPAGVVSG